MNKKYILFIIGYLCFFGCLYGQKKDTANASLKDTIQLEEVAVSTGYQRIPKERATGSFVQIDNELLNRRVSANLIDRLEGVVSGLVFNKNLAPDSPESPFSIRGRSTIMGNTHPLIIVDNFPYDGDLSTINPNDVSTVTVLRDAAAASIWGARAGNGVIVVITKQGRAGEALHIEVNSNVTVGTKPDLYYSPNFLNSTDFIDVEQFLFEKGYYTNTLNNSTTRPVVSPVVEILASALPDAEKQQRIDALRGLDIRDDLSRYFYQNSLSQQHALSFRGGGTKSTYYVSAGYDQNSAALKRNGQQRLSLNSNLSFRPLNNLEVMQVVSYTQTNTRDNNPGSLSPASLKSYYPYAQLTDGQGRAAALPKDYRYAYIDTLAADGLLDWRYRPLDELAMANNRITLTHLRVNPGLRYTVLPGLSAEVRYQYEYSLQQNKDLYDASSYFARNLVNLNTQLTPTGNQYPIASGAILDRARTQQQGHNFRAQVNLSRMFAHEHQVDALAGYESKSLRGENDRYRLYGYNDDVTTFVATDYAKVYSKYRSIAAQGRIPNQLLAGWSRDEFASWFANAGYTYRRRYIASSSIRTDKSNLFGVSTNQKSVPLWSAGLGWLLNEESFYRLGWLPYLKASLTYGYSGNVDKSLAAQTTASYSTNSLNQAPMATIRNPPNPNLRWEEIRTINGALHFSLKTNRLSGSVEYYHKTGRHLLGESPADPTSGVTSFKGNLANMKGAGWDITLNSINIRHAGFRWESNLLFSTATDEVTKYTQTVTSTIYLQNSAGDQNITISPVLGRPVFNVASYRWAGLDPETGDPLGYLNGEVSKDYSGILLNTSMDDLIYHGPARPTFFGAFRHTFTYQHFAASINLTYKLGYYYRVPSINYRSLVSDWMGNVDFEQRWQKTGDEAWTQIPSMVYPVDVFRDLFYQSTTPLVAKGDHIRLQDVQLSYELKQLKSRIYVYAANLGIIWKASDNKLDPDVVSRFSQLSYPNPASVSLGIQINL